MDEYSGLTDNELIARLKKYAIPHGPVVGSTRKLYEKKIYECETERTKYPGRSEAYTEPRSSHSFTRETFVSPRSRDDLDYGREALGAARTLKESYDSARNEEYTDYGDEDPSPTKSYLSHNYSFPRHEGRYTYKEEDWEVNSSEGPTSSYRYESSLGSSRSHLGGVSARQPIAEPYLYSSSLKDVPSEGDSGSYQTVFHRKSYSPSPLGVEPRRAIRPELQAPEKNPGSGDGTKRYLPLWPQLLLFILLAGFLAFAYFFLQGNADDNPFVKYLQH